MSYSSFSEINSPSEEIRQNWVEAIITDSQFSAWTTKSAHAAAERLALEDSTQAYIAPNGVPDLIDQFFEDRLKDLQDIPISRENGTTQAVKAAILAWLSLLSEYRLAVQAAMTRATSLVDADKPLRQLNRTSDVIWNIAAEPIGNYNDTTRRLLLSLALMDILNHWVSHPNEDLNALDAFVETRLKQVSGAGRRVGQIAKFFSRASN